MPEVSVVIPARNEEAFIRAAVESVLAQTHTDLEVIVVDGMSEDNTVSIVEALAEADPRVRLVENPDRITPKAMNAGLHAARGTWLVRVDAHATVPPDYVERAISHLRSEKWGGVGGRKDGVGITSAGRAIAAAMASPFGVGNSVYHHGMETQTVDHIPFGAYPIALARELGGWDERLRVNQDFEFDWRIRQAGKDLLFDPALRIDWICRQSTKDLLKQYFRYGRGKVRVAALHPRSMSWRHVIPPAAVLWIALALVLLPFKPLWALAALAPYLAVVVLAAARTARHVPKADRGHLLAIFPAMHLGWGAGFWRGLIDVVRDGTKMQRMAKD